MMELLPSLLAIFLFMLVFLGLTVLFFYAGIYWWPRLLRLGRPVERVDEGLLLAELERVADHLRRLEATVERISRDLEELKEARHRPLY